MNSSQSSTFELNESALNRVIFYWMVLWCCLVTLVAGAGSVLSSFLTRNHRYFRFWSEWWARLMFAGCRITVKAERLGDLDKGQPYVFICNHQNAFDIPVAAISIDHPFGFVAKQELARIPVLGLAIKRSPSVFLDRSTVRASYESIQRAAARIRDGHSVIIFPEGARSWSRDIAPFRKGSFMLALEAGVPVVPVTIVNGFCVLDERRHVARPGQIRVIVGKPIRMDTITKKELLKFIQHVESGMKGLINEHFAKA